MEPIKFGRYVLLERLAFGGMAEVYLAFDTKGDENHQIVALKRILPNIADDHNYIAMFIDEGRLLRQLRNKNIPRIFDMGNRGNIYFQSLEFVFGVSLRKLWEVVWQNQKFPVPLACLIIQKIASTLDFAHKKRGNDGAPLGIIHRDVSPQNILIGYDGAVKVIDFGIAKAENRIASTQQGIIKGKVAYMAPEQALGADFNHRIDIYALGLIFYELLTGQRAYKADSDFALLQQVRQGKLNRQSAELLIIPKDVLNILEKAIHPKPKNRYQWAGDFAADLSKLISNQDWQCNREELSKLAKKTFNESYHAQKKRIQAYANTGQKGFNFNSVPNKPESSDQSETTKIIEDQLYSDESQTSNTDLSPIESPLSSNTDIIVANTHEENHPPEHLAIQDSLLKDDSIDSKEVNLASVSPNQLNPTRSMKMSSGPTKKPTMLFPNPLVIAVVSFTLGCACGFVFQKSPPSLAIATSPKGSSVFCDNKPICALTPCVFQNKCQSGKYIIQKEGYFFETIRANQFEKNSIIHIDLRPQLDAVR